MPKLLVAGLLVAVGLVAIFSQVFRDNPSIAIFLGGVVLAIFGAIAFSDERAGE